MRDNVRPRGACTHREYGSRGGAKGECYRTLNDLDTLIERSVFGKVRWRFRAQE